ncbi:zinc finger, PMZ-type containing protein, partial [Tanacetum coccineum]
PSIRKQLEKLKEKQREWLVIPSGYQELEVRNGDESYGVDLMNKVCGCRMWELSGVPCVHVMAGYMHLNKDPDNGGGGRGSRGGRMGRENETMNVNEDAQAGVGRGNTVGRSRWRGRRGGGRGKGRKGTGEFLETPATGYFGGPLTDEQEHYLRQDEESLREHLEEIARVKQEYLDRYRAEQEYEARMDWMHESHWQSDEDMLANNPTQPTQQSGVQQVQAMTTQQSVDHQVQESVDLNPSLDHVQDVQEDDANASLTKNNGKRPMSTDIQADEITPPLRMQKKDKAPPLPFRIYVKNRGRSERIENQKKLFKFDDKGTGSTHDLAFDCSP